MHLRPPSSHGSCFPPRPWSISAPVRRPAPRLTAALLLAALLTPVASLAQPRSESAASAAEVAPRSLPPAAGTQGTVLAHPVVLEAPSSAVRAYRRTFAERTWELGVASRAEFLAQLYALDLSAEVHDALADPELWRNAISTDPGFLQVRPPLTLLTRLQPAERRALYHLLAAWSGNKPERWPLVFRDEAALRELVEQGASAAIIDRVAALAYPFAGGLAFSDFSVLAAEFPTTAELTRFLELASRVDGVIPRLRLRTARSISESLAYWTVNYQNPFALPLLEALAESETTGGTELESFLPGAMRNRLFDLQREEVSHDFSINSFVIAASLGAPPADPRDPAGFFAWFEQEFAPAPPPFRFGDVLVLETANGASGERLPVAYACAFIYEGLVFAKDPTGLGLWRFLSLEELQQRNPHFAGARFVAWRRISRS